MNNRHWIQGDCLCESPLFRRSFSISQLPVSAELKLCGLGYFLLFVNGSRIGNQEFVPAMTSYSSVLGCKTTYPVWEERSNYRCLYLTYDLLPYLKEGENVIGIQLGNGWYHQTKRIDEGRFIFGFPKLKYELTLTSPHGEITFLESGPETLWAPSELISNNLFYGETQDLRLLQDNWCSSDADLSAWKPALPIHAPETKLEKQRCPSDRVLREISPCLLAEEHGRKLYDCRENISGWASIRCIGTSGEEIMVRYSEELASDGCSLDFCSTGGEKQIQKDCYICDGSERIVHPKFCWHAFRYIEVEGPGELLSAAVVCTDIAVTSSFQCSNPVLNWLYDAYIRTQINNYHNCIPSDCPHRERLGYTGDGQLTSETAMLTLDTKALYEKWYRDILDSQGADTGHIPHTAPFLGGGGGPGGWGGAVYLIPLNYYRTYGDSTLLKLGYPAILRWLEYMDSRCENGLITQEEKGGWCLGEWCAPAAETQEIPPAFINTYYYALCLKSLPEMAKIVQAPVPQWQFQRLSTSLTALKDTYFNTLTGDFCNGIGAANAFALALGIGTKQTAANLVTRYNALGQLDTGIFGTPVLLEQLFKNGAPNLAFRLLTSDTPASFSRMMKAGATTLWENWEGSESHDHPMFGSVVKLLFTEILGIRQKEGAVGFSDFYIKPADIADLEWAEGSLQTAAGPIHVKWTRSPDKTQIIL